MSSNSIGKNFTFTTWGESHGKAIGCVIDGVPSNIKLEKNDIQPFLNKRKPGQSKYTTQRKEEDEKKKKKQDTKVERIFNGALDSLLRGSGIYGAVISTVKNTIYKFMEERDKGFLSL